MASTIQARVGVSQQYYINAKTAIFYEKAVVSRT